jgi:hypothetical protein
MRELRRRPPLGCAGDYDYELDYDNEHEHDGKEVPAARAARALGMSEVDR